MWWVSEKLGRKSGCVEGRERDGSTSMRKAQCILCLALLRVVTDLQTLSWEGRMASESVQQRIMSTLINEADLRQHLLQASAVAVAAV